MTLVKKIPRIIHVTYIKFTTKHKINFEQTFMRKLKLKYSKYLNIYKVPIGYKLSYMKISI